MLIDSGKMIESVKNYCKGCIEFYGSVEPKVDMAELSKDLCGLVVMVAEAYPVNAEQKEGEKDETD